MKSFLIICCYLFLSTVSNAQSDSIYQTLVAKASLLHLQKDYKKAITYYDQAFRIKEADALTAYKAAGMYSLDGNANKAFEFLQLSIANGWTEADWLLSDPYFDQLKNIYPTKWKTIQVAASSADSRYEKTLALPALRKEINLMALFDQKLRYQKVQAKNDSVKKSINEQIMRSDLRNMNRAKEIIIQYGWPKISQIGKDGQNNLWLIVQHADQDVLFQQTALSAMEKLNGTKEINMENYAFLFDRVQCNLNYKQRYGTQVEWTSNGKASAFRPIAEEYMTDERRQKIGLIPLKIYALTYGFDYHNISMDKSTANDADYKAQVQLLIDSAKYSYEKNEFQKVYDFYNSASTFLGGMSNADNFEAAIIFSKIAMVNKDEKYKSIALDFLDLLFLRSSLNKKQLLQQPSFNILHKEPRWLNIHKRVD
ncbi:tetratricopeptide repeat protein [Terrimonas sp. NA20]|uniref:Tetratricopeptide repeat protein n=1 Tax=Terrimonas ginsenosidimutans TaxID=2908004 RepID=A0ABS9KZ54_9BACT|nr:tetratricopeptide repeat protein [Terrimonas ginsenosidimutans]MCG2617622.1 tetratricopeptide repeat protein [Terrimonas ginsenosidimutans]